jgi:hypothetical protein
MPSPSRPRQGRHWQPSRTSPRISTPTDGTSRRPAAPTNPVPAGRCRPTGRWRRVTTDSGATAAARTSAIDVRPRVTRGTRWRLDHAGTQFTNDAHVELSLRWLPFAPHLFASNAGGFGKGVVRAVAQGRARQTVSARRLGRRAPLAAEIARVQISRRTARLHAKRERAGSDDASEDVRRGVVRAMMLLSPRRRDRRRESRSRDVLPGRVVGSGRLD